MINAVYDKFLPDSHRSDVEKLASFVQDSSNEAELFTVVANAFRDWGALFTSDTSPFVSQCIERRMFSCSTADVPIFDALTRMGKDMHVLFHAKRMILSGDVYGFTIAGPPGWIFPYPLLIPISHTTPEPPLMLLDPYEASVGSLYWERSDASALLSLAYRVCANALMAGQLMSESYNAFKHAIKINAKFCATYELRL